MSMSIPIFLLFGVYGVINTYLPLFLRDLGYSVSLVGVLLAIFEIAGLVFPLIISPLVARKGSYGKYLVFFGIIMITAAFPLVSIGSFWVSAFFLTVFAVGFKGSVPVSDALANQLLGVNGDKYGRVRVMGSIGFVIMTLIMQFAGNIATASRFERFIWIAVPSVLFTVSMLVVPGLMQNRPAQDEELRAKPANAPASSAQKQSIFVMLREFSPSFWFGILLIFLGFFGLVPSQRFISLYVEEYLHINAAAGLWALSALSEIPFMFFSNRFLKRYGSMPLIIFCLGAVFARGLVYVVLPNFAGAIIGQLFNSVTYGLFHPVAVSFVANKAPRQYMVVGMSLYSILAVGGASVIGNLAGGFIIDNLGYSSLFTLFALFPLLGIALYYIAKKKGKRKFSL